MQSVANFLNVPKFQPEISLSSLVSVSLLMLLLFGIHSLKTFVHHPLLPHLERSSNLSLRKGLSSLGHFLFWLLCGADLFLFLDFEFCILLLSCCTLESTTQWRLSAMKVKLELEFADKICDYIRRVGFTDNIWQRFKNRSFLNYLGQF